MKMLYLLGLLILFLENPSHSVYIVDDEGNPIPRNQVSNDNSKFPDSCIVRSNIGTDKAAYGSGTFLSENVVLTARHNICKLSEEKFSATTIELVQMGMMHPDSIKVELNGRIFDVQETKLFKDGLDDIALLVLKPFEEKLPFIVFKSVSAVKVNETIPSVTVMGYGHGGLISDKIVLKQDSQFPGGGSYFRHHEEKKASLKIIDQEDLIVGNGSLPQVGLSSKLIKMGKGDSGSALINDKNQIIGVAICVNKKFGQMIEKLDSEIVSEITKSNKNEEIYEKEGVILGQIISYSFNLFDVNEAKSFLDIYYKYKTGYDFREYHLREQWSQLITEKKLSFNKDLLEKLKDKNFSSSFQCFNEVAVNWINETIFESKHPQNHTDDIYTFLF